MLESIYSQKITILNKLRRKDSPTGKDEWYKHTINNAAWYENSARSAGNSAVYIGTFITALIPFEQNENYLPYHEWKDCSNKEKYFTMATGDYLILGPCPETVNAGNVISVMEGYEETSCQVKSYKHCYARGGALVQLRVQGV